MNELSMLEQRLGSHTLPLVKAELINKMKKAEKGLLTYGDWEEGGDVVLMGATDDVLELRLSAYTGDGGQGQETLQVRLFFSEPANYPDMLCALMLYWKRPGPIDLDEQTDCSRRASRRLHEHMTRL